VSNIRQPIDAPRVERTIVQYTIECCGCQKRGALCILHSLSFGSMDNMDQALLQHHCYTSHVGIKGTRQTRYSHKDETMNKSAVSSPVASLFLLAMCYAAVTVLRGPMTINLGLVHNLARPATALIMVGLAATAMLSARSRANALAKRA